MPYSDPLCNKCLHQQDYHSELVSRLDDGIEIRRCTIGICPCLITTGQKTSKQKEAETQ